MFLQRVSYSLLQDSGTIDIISRPQRPPAAFPRRVGSHGAFLSRSRSADHASLFIGFIVDT